MIINNRFLNHFLKFCDPHIHTSAEVLGQECLGENGRSRSQLTLQNYLNLTSLLTNSPILAHKAAPCEEFSERCVTPVAYILQEETRKTSMNKRVVSPVSMVTLPLDMIET